MKTSIWLGFFSATHRLRPWRHYLRILPCGKRPDAARLGTKPEDKVDWLVDHLKNKPAPKYPFPIDAARAAQGKAVFDANCAACHASTRTGT